MEEHEKNIMGNMNDLDYHNINYNKHNENIGQNDNEELNDA